MKFTLEFFFLFIFVLESSNGYLYNNIIKNKFRNTLLSISLITSPFTLTPTLPSLSIDNTATTLIVSNTKSTNANDVLIYKSGKNPRGPPVNKDDKTGTKKDRKFLKCISNCKGDCESPTGGLATNRVDCVQDCQDQCCETYEQCSYKIKIGSDTGSM
mgnify:CR=1 FL=1